MKFSAWKWKRICSDLTCWQRVGQDHCYHVLFSDHERSEMNDKHLGLLTAVIILPQETVPSKRRRSLAFLQRKSNISFKWMTHTKIIVLCVTIYNCPAITMETLSYYPDNWDFSQRKYIFVTIDTIVEQIHMSPLSFHLKRLTQVQVSGDSLMTQSVPTIPRPERNNADEKTEM